MLDVMLDNYLSWYYKWLLYNIKMIITNTGTKTQEEDKLVELMEI